MSSRYSGVSKLITKCFESLMHDSSVDEGVTIVVEGLQSCDTLQRVAVRNTGVQWGRSTTQVDSL